MMQSQKEEETEHEADKDRMKIIIKQFDVELIVLGANSLEARRLKKTLDEISETLKAFAGSSSGKDPAATQLERR
jgi:hypothetical protein